MKADGHTGKDIAKYLGINLPAGLVRNHSRESGFRADVQVRRTKERKGGQWQTGTLKSKRSRRTVPLPPWLAELAFTNKVHILSHTQSNAMHKPIN